MECEVWVFFLCWLLAGFSCCSVPVSWCTTGHRLHPGTLWMQSPSEAWKVLPGRTQFPGGVFILWVPTVQLCIVLRLCVLHRSICHVRRTESILGQKLWDLFNSDPFPCLAFFLWRHWYPMRMRKSRRKKSRRNDTRTPIKIFWYVSSPSSVGVQDWSLVSEMMRSRELLGFDHTCGSFLKKP